MAKYSIEDTTLNGIADAIREKTGDTAELTPLAMPAAIAGITGGGSGSGGGFNLDNCDVTLLSQIPKATTSGTNYYWWTEWKDYITSIDDVQIMIVFDNKNTYWYIKGLCGYVDENTVYIYEETNNTSYSTNTITDVGTGDKIWTMKFDDVYGLQVFQGSFDIDIGSGKAAVFLVTTKGAV